MRLQQYPQRAILAEGMDIVSVLFTIYPVLVPQKPRAWGGKGANFGCLAWTACKDLSVLGVIYNAQSYAFFGFVARLISPRPRSAVAQRVIENGTFEILTCAV